MPNPNNLAEWLWDQAVAADDMADNVESQGEDVRKRASVVRNFIEDMFGQGPTVEAPVQDLRKSARSLRDLSIRVASGDFASRMKQPSDDDTAADAANASET